MSLCPGCVTVSEFARKQKCVGLPRCVSSGPLRLCRGVHPGSVCVFACVQCACVWCAVCLCAVWFSLLSLIASLVRVCGVVHAGVASAGHSRWL